MDFQYDKIYNEWVLAILTAGLLYCARTGGIAGMVKAAVFMTLPFMILYPLFMIGVLGAGDIKLMAVISCFLTFRQIFVCLIVSFFIGAVFSLLKMIAEHNFLQRMNYLLSYIHDLSASGEWKLYEEDSRERNIKNKGKIHFALPVLLSVMLIKGGRI